MILFDPILFDGDIFDDVVPIFDSNIFDSNIFDTGDAVIPIPIVVITEQKVGSGGGAGVTWNRITKYRKVNGIWLDREEPKAEEKKEEIKINVTVNIERTTLQFKANEIEIFTSIHISTIIPVMYPVIPAYQFSDIEIETVEDYYDEDEIIKMILMLAA